MMITIGELADSLREQKRTGTVVFALEPGQPELACCFQAGLLCRVSQGNRQNRECLSALKEGRYRSYTYRDAPPDGASSGGQQPELARALLECRRLIEQDNANGTEQVVKTPLLGPDVIERLRVKLEDILGPIASLLFGNCLRTVGYRPGAGVSRGGLDLILQALTEELPEGERPAFLRQFRNA